MIVIASDNAPQALGPYSQAVKVGEVVYCSGQIPLVPSGLVVSDDIIQQARQVIDNLEALVEAAGCTLRHVAKLTLSMTDLKQLPVVNAVVLSRWPGLLPACTVVGVSALPRGAHIELEAIVVKSDDGDKHGL